MSPDPFEFRAPSLPADLPPREQIVQLCAEAGFRQNGISFPSTSSPRFWIKYGDHRTLTLGEALTQHAVAQVVNAEASSVVRVPEVYIVFVDQSFRYIIMQYITGATVASRQPSPTSYVPGDVEAVAAAYSRLVSLRVSADSAPGFVGEHGLIGHYFFLEGLSSVRYAKVKDLQAQINKLVAPQGLRVDFADEIAEGLVLCPSDVDPNNFIINDKGEVIAIDFGHTGFMPVSFVAYSLKYHKDFTRKVAHFVKYPKPAGLSAKLFAMETAAGLLTMSGNNALGE
ncbi:hypothetical protein BDZ89DRAFT_1008777 [Hymenopellis radicata]|nr:hypothetical protein BDZ89DRAFT_1008777 [Hymenopellis radicata]